MAKNNILKELIFEPADRETKSIIRKVNLKKKLAILLVMVLYSALLIFLARFVSSSDIIIVYFVLVFWCGLALSLFYPSKISIYSGKGELKKIRTKREGRTVYLVGDIFLSEVNSYVTVRLLCGSMKITNKTNLDFSSKPLSVKIIKKGFNYYFLPIDYLNGALEDI